MPRPRGLRNRQGPRTLKNSDLSIITRILKSVISIPVDVDYMLFLGFVSFWDDATEYKPRETVAPRIPLEVSTTGVVG